MNDRRYILEKYKGMSTRYQCPVCKRSNKTFTRYIDTQTGEHLSDNVGRCSRESNCGYHYTPKQYFQNNGIKPEFLHQYAHTREKNPVVTPQQKPVSFIPVEIFKASLKTYDDNNFVKFLTTLFGAEVTCQLISRYFIASSKYWDGASVFWQIDISGKVRTGKIMLYDAATGKRVKEPFNYINWAHKALKQAEYELKQCLFGEHLLNDKTKPVAIVESEKTAVIASVYLPQFIWLAVGSLTNLTTEKCSVLKGRSVLLFPDLNGFEKWSAKAKELSHIAIFTVSDLLERKATDAERKQGLDLADYLINFNYKEFIEPENLIKPNISENENLLKPVIQNKWEMLAKVSISENWEQDIDELEAYFTGIALPTQAVKLNSYTTVKDVSKFIESHFAIVKANNGKRTFLPYLNRLEELKQILTTNLN